ncbi:M1 family metallopeptidase [Flavisolibacter sp. BT320]|nr:M1 family metallopeptidase [Flavisolibacter longurius]
MLRFFSLFLLLSGFSSPAQELYKPRDVKKAFANGTRSDDGKPGKAYWQNRGRYTINIKATPPDRIIYGTEDITYVNNSPTELKQILLKLFMNMHRAGAPRAGGSSPEYLTKGVVIDSILVDGKKVRFNPTTFTNLPLSLPTPLRSNDSVQLSIAWHYEISLAPGREGVIDSTTFFLAYFYPRVAVYDDYRGWDATPHTGPLEFYNDFNDYTLNVQVPKNYLVWATGTLTNPTAVLKPEAASRYQQSLTSDKVVKIVSPQDLAAKSVTAENNFNTWQFTSANIPDVAVGLSDHYVWDGSSLVVDRKTGRRASMQAAYNDTAQDFHHMVRFGKESLSWLSNSWPGIPYPYEKSVVFQGYAGMEYPMMANDETYEDTTFSKFVAMHELAHTYMPFYMGINETRYGFMDEGWVTAFEYLFNTETMGKEKGEELFKQFRVRGWTMDPSQEQDMPIITTGSNLSGGGLGNNIYGKPALAYLALKELLGDALFKKALHEYMSRWHGKHPIPWDFFNTYNSATGQNLNWFWNSWFFSPNYIDLKVQEVKSTAGTTTLTVQNVGGMPVPFDAVVTYSDGTTESFRQSPAVWKKNGKAATVPLKTKKAVTSVKLEGGIFMDAAPEDNEWRKGA